MEHILSKTILIEQTIELLAKKYELCIDEARDRFYNSEIINLLEDDETNLFSQSALYLLSLYEEHQKKAYLKSNTDFGIEKK